MYIVFVTHGLCYRFNIVFEVPYICVCVEGGGESIQTNAMKPESVVSLLWFLLIIWSAEASAVQSEEAS